MTSHSRLACFFSLLLLLFVVGCHAPLTPPPPTPSPTPFQPFRPTATPFVFLHPTSAPTLAVKQIPPQKVEPSPPPDFPGIDFNDTSAWITLIITPPNNQVNQGHPIRIKFLPGSTCDFGTHRGCISTFQSGNSGVIFVSVHSGMGGEGQDFRNSVEGTSINSAWFPVDQVLRNLNSLAGAQVSISQSGHTVDAQLARAARVPAQGLQGYLNTPVENALSYASAYDHGLDAFAPPNQPILVFETCGWRMLSENWNDAVSDTTASIYLGVIQQR
jgi:hypothetical protein